MMQENAIVVSLEKAKKYLISAQDTDGVFKLGEGNPDPWSTAEAIIALSIFNDRELADIISLSLKWLINKQLYNGSWQSSAYNELADGRGDVATTAYSLRAISATGGYVLGDFVTKAIDWICRVQNDDGGWNLSDVKTGFSHLGFTAFAVSALAGCGVADIKIAESIQRGCYFLHKNMLRNGGWPLFPGGAIDITISGYSLRALIDAYVWRGHLFPVDYILMFLKRSVHTVDAEGYWSNWLGHNKSIESLSYVVEIGATVHSKVDVYSDSILKLISSQNSDGGWGVEPKSNSLVWTTYNAAVALGCVVGLAEKVRPIYPVPVKDVFKKNVDKYHIAISCSKNDRDIAEIFSFYLEREGVLVFFDSRYPELFWGSNLPTFLYETYRNNAYYCVILFSEEYKKSLWTKIEEDAAVMKRIKEDPEYILPILTDGSTPPILFESIGYQRLTKNNTIEMIASVAAKKLRQRGLI